MKFWLRYTFLFVLTVFFINHGFAQAQILFTEDFNECALPADWTSEITGNQDAVWGVGIPENTNSDSSTIDGSCLLLFDDDLTGDATEAWAIDVTSPAFDATGYTTIGMSIDVHFRNYGEANALHIQVFDGTDFQTLKTYSGWDDQTGEQFSEFVTYTADISFFAHENTQIRIRFEDGDEWVWWAAVDNLTVWGEGEGQNVLLESFNDCALPDDWIAEVVNGDDPWQFGYFDNGNTAATSMNGSCFIFFDDDGVGQEAAPSTVRLISPEIDGTSGAQMQLSFDLILRTWEENESLIVGVYDVDNDIFQIVGAYQSDVGGPDINEFITQAVDLSGYRSKRMRLVFQYDDGGTWGWWIGVDNIKLSVSGELNELCSKAIPLQIATDSCTTGTTLLALFDGPSPVCTENSVGSLWYTFTADQTSWLQIKTEADFNDVITLLSGGCEDLTAVHCDNRDEHGFTGENAYFEVQEGQDYFIRVSGQAFGFGRSRGEFCLNLSYVSAPPEHPTNELCAAAIPLQVDGDCVEGHNFWANMPDPLPSRAILSRAGIWYTFTATSTDALEIRPNTDFSETITLYNGTCNNLTEVAINEFGERLQFDSPEVGQTYFLQISGAFATVEGNLCAAVNTIVTEAPENDLCFESMELTLGSACTMASNELAGFDGPTISCSPFLDASIWFHFIAPASGSVQLAADANFAQAVSIYSGTCNDLEEISCQLNPLTCDGYMEVNSLTPGETYFMRISSLANASGVYETGDVCVLIRDAQDNPTGMPLDLQVTYSCYNNGTAVLDIQVSGGDGNYFYEGNTEQDVISAGEIFLVIVTDGFGCERAVSGMIDCEAENNCALNATAEIMQFPSCFNTADGAASISVDGGTGEYEYIWPSGQGTAEVSNLLPGDYIVTVTDGDGCEAGVPVIMEGPPSIDLAIINVQNANGGANGSIQHNVFGGTGSLTELWFLNGAPFPDIDLSALAVGDYQLSVTDESGCEVLSDIITITDITGIDDPIADAYWVNAAPVPTAGPLTLNWKLADDGLLFVFDALGKQVMAPRKVAAEMSNYRLDLSDFPAGLYLLKWETAAGVSQVKRVLRI